MATGWMKTVSAAPSEIAIAAAPNSVLLNGRIDGCRRRSMPSANSTMASPVAMPVWRSRSPASPDVRLRSRSTKTVRCSFDSVPISGQPAISDSGDETTSTMEPSTMDVGPGDVVWTRPAAGARLDSVPVTWMRKPSAQMISLCQSSRMNVSGRPARSSSTRYLQRHERPASPAIRRGASARRILIVSIMSPDCPRRCCG